MFYHQYLVIFSALFIADFFPETYELQPSPSAARIAFAEGTPFPMTRPEMFYLPDQH